MQQNKNIRVGGTGAIHLAGAITDGSGNGGGNGDIEVRGSEADGTQPHLILSGNNKDWSGKLDVGDRAFVIAKTDQAIGRGSSKNVLTGGTIGFRSHLETGLDYKRPLEDKPIEATGLGIVRAEGTQRIGAIYNDGGKNVIDLRIQMNKVHESAETGFGSRGDRGGSLEIKDRVQGDGPFIKLGPGLIILSYPGNPFSPEARNSWTKDTELLAGVLRITTDKSLPTASGLNGSDVVFKGGRFGGILELGYDNFTRNVGKADSTTESRVRWEGDGGFSAFGGARTVNLGGSGAMLTWGRTEHFIGDGFALLLSSRYANDVITFENAISFGAGFAGQQREVRVARGESNAYGVLSGVLSGGPFGGLLKTGDGLLHITGANTYRGATVIRSGALRGTVPAPSNIQLAGGVIGIDSTFTRTIGTGNNQVQWMGSGGFAAYGGGEVLVQLGGPDQIVTWGQTGFVQNRQELRFGHYTANGTVVWDTGIDLWNSNMLLPRTIRVERGQQAGADVEFRKAITSEWVVYIDRLEFVGNGRIDLSADSSELRAKTININGAELRLHGAGSLSRAQLFDIRHGGLLNLVNTSGGSNNDRISNTAPITLAAGTLRLSSGNVDVSERVGDLTLEAGANTVGLSRGVASAELRISRLKRDSDSRATLNIEGNLADSLLRFRLNTSASSYAINDSPGDPIIPWATNGDTWLIAHSENSTDHFLKGLANVSYYTAGENNWGTVHNVKTSGTTTLGGVREINSLVLGGNLALSSQMLILNSGGLMITGNRTISGTTNTVGGIMAIGTLTTGTPSGGPIRPLYIHNSGTLTFTGSARLNGGMDVVKTRTGSLIFNNSGTNVTQHIIGNLYIHQGTVELRGNGTLRVRDRIIIGDGAGTDKLILPGNRWNPITKAGVGLPSITLHGTPYDPRGPEYGGDQAILQLGGNTKQRIANLHIEGRGTIDWRGGEVGQANILWIDSLTFNNTSAQLFIRNWYEYEDLFLISRSWFNARSQAQRAQLLSQILFEGYQDYATTWKDYDADYYQIYPFGIRPVPEPSTYGAILGTVGIALWGWKKRKRKPHSSPDAVGEGSVA